MSLIINYTRYTKSLFIGIRGFCGSIPDQSSNKAIQRRWQKMTERYMKRTTNMLSGTGSDMQKSKKGKFPHAIHMSNFLIGSSSSSAPNPGCQRRAHQLGVVFLDYITSLLSSGEVCPELNELGFDIVKVKVVSDLSVINVFWAATGGSEDDAITALLPRCSSELRSKLTDLRIMGNLPPIQFVKDLTASRLREVESLLKVADMGPEFEPSALEDLKMEPTIVTNLVAPSRRIKNKLQWLNDFSSKPGPGGSYEIDVAAKNLFVDAAEGTNNSEIVAEADFIEKTRLAYTETNDFKSVKRRSGFGDEATSGTDNVTDTVPKGFRYDIYGIDHSALYQQVLHTKRRNEDRSYRQHQQANSSNTSLDSSAVSSTKSDISNVLANKKKDAKRPFREINQLLSSQFHLQSDS